MGIKILKNKIPFIITMFCCVTVAALAASVRTADGAKSAQTYAERSPKQVVVLDAGHPTFLLTTTPFIEGFSYARVHARLWKPSV